MARLVRLREVSTDTGLSKWTLARLEAAGEFPKRIRIGKSAIAWDADEIAEWLCARPDDHDVLGL